MINIREFFDPKRASVFLIILSFLLYNLETIAHSQFFSFYKLSVLILSISISEIFLKLITKNSESRVKNIFEFVVIYLTILFFFGLYFINYIISIFQQYINIQIRGRVVFEAFIIIIIILILIRLFINKKRIYNYTYLNVFFLIFSLISIVNNFKLIKNDFNTNLNKSGFVSFSKSKTPAKPTIFIISDEYSSPDELNRIFKDSSIYSFSNKLEKNGWLVKTSFFSHEISTIHSLSSVFNFNLSKHNEYKKIDNTIIATSKILKSTFADSLDKKKIEVINYGIFHVGRSKYLNRLYFYPTSFLEEILTKTIFFTLKSNTGNFKKNGIRNSFYPMEDHNKYIFNRLSDTLRKIVNPKTFIYVHLYMPHSPMQFNPTFPYRSINNLDNYTDYWKFTNLKLINLMSELIKENRYRIILTGDHGYRSDKRINPHLTFTAFYGFDKNLIEKIESVQDIGSLIYGSY